MWKFLVTTAIVAQFSLVEAILCKQIVTVENTSATEIIQAPYSIGYPKRLDCEWTIKVNLLSLEVITFVQLHANLRGYYPWLGFYRPEKDTQHLNPDADGYYEVFCGENSGAKITS